MADIAFLLLLFFLVSTTISQEKGITRKLPTPCPTGQDCSVTIPERNILRIFINDKNELLVGTSVTPLNELQEVVQNFLDNNGKGTCYYCNGTRLVTSSDHPKNAVVSLSSDRLANYSVFIAVQDELSKVYKTLRERYAMQQFGVPFDSLSEENLKETQQAYPFMLSEASVR